MREHVSSNSYDTKMWGAESSDVEDIGLVDARLRAGSMITYISCFTTTRKHL